MRRQRLMFASTQDSIAEEACPFAGFVIDDSSFCFINCHLAAGQTHRRQRDRDLADILESKASFSELGSSSPGAYAPGGAGTMVFDHEMTIVR